MDGATFILNHLTAERIVIDGGTFINTLIQGCDRSRHWEHF